MGWKEGEAGGDVYMPSPLGPALKNDLPGIDDYVRIREPWGESFIKVDDDTRRMQVSLRIPRFSPSFPSPYCMEQKRER